MTIRYLPVAVEDPDEVSLVGSWYESNASESVVVVHTLEDYIPEAH